MSENIRVVNDSNFDAEVKQVADKPVFVDFWAPWCAPCRMLGPLLEEAADTYAGKVVVAKYNVDESNQVATENGSPPLSSSTADKMSRRRAMRRRFLPAFREVPCVKNPLPHSEAA